jgi:uncharacterized protein
MNPNMFETYTTSQYYSLAPTFFDCDCLFPGCDRDRDCDCDCLFPGTDTLPARPLPAGMPIQCLPHLPYIPLSSVYTAAFAPLTSQVAVLNQPALHLLNRFHEPRLLAELNADEFATVQQFYQVGLLQPYGSIPPIAPVGDTRDTLVAWLHTTSACNLACSYCYVQKGTEHMTGETAFAAVDAVLYAAQGYGYRGVYIKYAGGEPSLNLPVVVQSYRYAQACAAEAGVQVDGVVLSNGASISEMWLQRFAEVGLRLMVSLDGPPQFHDWQRPRQDGHGSFAGATATIEHARSLGLPVTVSITITTTSVAGLPELVQWLLEREIPFSFNFCREHKGTQGNDTAAIADDEQYMIAGMQAAYRVIEQHPPRYSILGNLLDRANLSMAHRYTCSVGEHYLVIDQRGRVAKCQMDIAHPVATIWDDDPLGAVREDRNGVQNLPVEQKAECSGCEWYAWCTGGCPVVAHQATGRYDARSPHCAMYQALFPEVIRLEGVRLLHWAGTL